MTARLELWTRRPAALALLAVSLFGCGDGAPVADGIDLENCRAVSVMDDTGARVVGIEDMSLDAGRGLLYLSAYDRRAVDTELDEPAGPRTAGGLYSLDLHEPIESTVRVGRVKAAGGDRLPERPHGITLSGEDTNAPQLFAIERRYVQDDDDWRLAPEIAVITLDRSGRVAASVSRLSLPEAICSPNDIAATSVGLFVSNDHGACLGIDRLLEDIFALDSSFVVKLTPAGFERAVSKLRYANGVAVLESDELNTLLAVAATRAKGIFFFPLAVTGATRRDALPVLRLAAAPDNITRGADGALYVAAHPDILRYARFRSGPLGVRSAPSAVYRIAYSPSGELESRRIFHDPQGAVISGATVAVRAGERLFIGAAYDDRLAICTFAATEIGGA